MVTTNLSKVMGAAKLVALPDIYFRLKRILDDPDFAMAEVAVVISQDPALTAHLLRLVNSALYRFTTKIETVSRAISLLGTQQIHDLVLGISVADAFQGMSTEIMDMKRFWRRSFYCAVASRQLAVLTSSCDDERLFVAGLLHDIGHLLMYQAIPALAQQAIVLARENSEPLYMAERRLVGFDYAQAGADLMRQWSLPESLWQITLLHTEPAMEQMGKYPLETALVHLGALLARAADGEGNFNQGSLAASTVAWTITGLSPEACLALHEQIEANLSEIASLFASGPA